MHESMRCVQSGEVLYYISTKLSGVRHGFTAKAGGVSQGDCESLNLGFQRGDETANVLQNYKIITKALSMPYDRLTMTNQVHRDEVSIVTEETVGMGLARQMAWESDAIITKLPDTPLVGYYADCVVTLLYDPVARVCGVCHAGWRGTAAGILRKTVTMMAEKLGAEPQHVIAVMGPSIHQECFETNEDVPEAMEAQLGAQVRPFIHERGAKFDIDLQGVNAMLLREAGVAPQNIVDSGICTRCQSDLFWSHRATNGKRGVQGAFIAL